MSEWSQTWTWIDGKWQDGNTPILGPRSHAFWLASVVFDGARAFEGVAPDLDLHCARVNRSAKALGLKPTMATGRIIELAHEGIAKFGANAELYIKPMYWAEQGLVTSVPPDGDSTRFCLCLYDAPMPKPSGSSITLSPFRKPASETMPIDAKAACLYPNNGRAILEARARGFDNALMCDTLGNIAELATANVFLGRGGVVLTPVPNGSFLDGITRQRVIKLLRDRGVEVREVTLTYADCEGADEIFQAGNYGKVMPVTRIGERSLQPGPLYAKARKAYWAYAHGG